MIRGNNCVFAVITLKLFKNYSLSRCKNDEEKNSEAQSFKVYELFYEWMETLFDLHKVIACVDRLSCSLFC